MGNKTNSFSLETLQRGRLSEADVARISKTYSSYMVRSKGQTISSKQKRKDFIKADYLISQILEHQHIKELDSKDRNSIRTVLSLLFDYPIFEKTEVFSLNSFTQLLEPIIKGSLIEKTSILCKVYEKFLTKNNPQNFFQSLLLVIGMRNKNLSLILTTSLLKEESMMAYVQKHIPLFPKFVFAYILYYLNFNDTEPLILNISHFNNFSVEPLFFTLPETLHLILNKKSNILFDTTSNGVSFVKLVHSVSHYPGPLVFLIKDNNKNQFGFYYEPDPEYNPNSVLKSTGSYISYGLSKSFLFTLNPAFRVLKGFQENTLNKGNSVYVNVGVKTKPKGIGFGFGGSLPGMEVISRVWIGENFGEKTSDERICYARDIDYSYEKGKLLELGECEDDRFVLDRLVVLGLGGIDAKTKQRERQEELSDIKNDRKKVDKKQFVDSSFDKEFLLGKTFGSGQKDR
eukprot:snap_masked-scaffold_13-processed-gene-9.27-mRNA-1 protein AED:1.00 eAED:1.00 QI:0/-1/0/0/-1/1/1/0/457